MEKSVPPGFVPPEEAILEIASAMEPSIWFEDRMSEEESRIWDGLNIEFPGENLVEMLDSVQASERSQSLRLRQHSFWSALEEIRRSLHCKSLQAWGFARDWDYIAFPDFFHLDDDGQAKIDFDALADRDKKVALPIEGRCWSDLTLSRSALLNGFVYVAGEVESRLLFFSASEVADQLEGRGVLQHEEEKDGRLERRTAISAPPIEAYRTGAPGRPTAMSFVEQEFERRAAANALADTLSAESKSLHAWCVAGHPNIASPKEGSIENKIRTRFRQRKGMRRTDNPQN